MNVLNYFYKTCIYDNRVRRVLNPVKCFPRFRNCYFELVIKLEEVS